MTTTIGSLCTGYGGLDLGVQAAVGGARIAWCADSDPHITTLLATRLPGVPNLGDLREIDWTALEPVDVLTAGFPCQDISAAGRRAGIEKGARSGVWSHVVAGVRHLRPAHVVVENVAALRWRGGGLHRVLGDLADAGYDALWRSVRASDVGAPHRRERVFLLAWPRNTPPAAHPTRLRHRNTRPPGRPWVPPTAVPAGPAPGPAPHPEGDRRDEGLPSPTREQRRPDAALGDHPTPRPTGTSRPAVSWGVYEAAIRRWEAVLGRPTPCPVQPGTHGRPVLAPAFVEHLMGLPAGWVTDLDLPRTAQLRALGNGVVPQQAAHALALLLTDLTALDHPEASTA